MKRSLGLAGGLFALLTAVLVLGAATANAQPRRGMQDPGERLERMMAHLTPTLELTEDQAGKVRTILGEQLEKQKEMFEAGRARQDRDSLRASMTKWRDETDSRMAEVLSEEQLTKYKKYMEKNRRGPRGRRGGRGRRR